MAVALVAVTARRSGRISTLLLLCGFVLLGMFLWSLRSTTISARDLRHIRTDAGQTVQITGVVQNIPALRQHREGRYRAADAELPVQTLLQLSAEGLALDGISVPVTGNVRVIIEGDAVSRCVWGDRVTLPGKLQTEFVQQNPGEFNYQRFLHVQSCSGVLFVRHPLAVRVIHSVSPTDPRLWLCGLRRESLRLMELNLSPSIRPLAEALLLGNRGYLDPSMEQDFVVTGAMHLLAISGLHVGILYVFLMRLSGLLLIERNRALLLALSCCIFYAFLTDLRPSVLRSVGFIFCNVVSQILSREAKLLTLTGNTAAVYTLLDPGVVFDVGAWLSFLAAGALGWSGSVSPAVFTEGSLQAPALSWREWWTRCLYSALRWLTGAWRQMASVTMFSMPIVASEFHVISVSGLMINILLIPFSVFVMVSGFVFVGIGLILPAAGWLPGTIFEMSLWGLILIVDRTADLNCGAALIPEQPRGFLFLYYSLLLIMVLPPSRRAGLAARFSLVMVVLSVLWQVVQRPECSGLTCTVLSVGHGNAVVAETPDQRVLVFDAGSMGRAERTADRIVGFLCHRGFRMIDGLVISHADADHYNAVATLLERVPVGTVYLTSETANATDPGVRQLLTQLEQRRIPVCLITDGDQLKAGALSVSFHQASLDAAEKPNDNELSLVAILDYAGRRIGLPGDLELRGATRLREQLPEVDVLVSPHHGSPNSNTPITAATFRPQTVIVSGRSVEVTSKLSRTFGDSIEILHTETSGAVAIEVSEDSVLSLKSFR
jgi:competence protein ComEC